MLNNDLMSVLSLKHTGNFLKVFSRLCVHAMCFTLYKPCFIFRCSATGD